MELPLPSTLLKKLSRSLDPKSVAGSDPKAMETPSEFMLRITKEGKEIRKSDHLPTAVNIDQRSDRFETERDDNFVRHKPTQSKLDVEPDGRRRRSRSKSPGEFREKDLLHVDSEKESRRRERSKSPRRRKDKGTESSDGSKRRSRDIQTMKSYPESTLPAVRKKTSTQVPLIVAEPQDETDVAPTRRGRRYADDKTEKRPKTKSKGMSRAAKESQMPFSEALDETEMGSTRLGKKYVGIPDGGIEMNLKSPTEENKGARTAPQVHSDVRAKSQVHELSGSCYDEIDIGPTRMERKYVKPPSVDNKYNEDIIGDKPKTSRKVKATKVKTKKKEKKDSSSYNEQGLDPTESERKYSKSPGLDNKYDEDITLDKTKASGKTKSTKVKTKKKDRAMDNLDYDELVIESTRSERKYSKQAGLDNRYANEDTNLDHPKTSGKTKSTKAKAKKKEKVDSSSDFILSGKKGNAQSKKNNALWKENVGEMIKNVAHMGSDVYGSLSKKSGKAALLSAGKEIEENYDEESLQTEIYKLGFTDFSLPIGKRRSFIRQLSTNSESTYGDNGDNDLDSFYDASPDGDPLPLKRDSDATEDRISFAGLSAPPEIFARGQRARRAYAEAAQAGTKKVFRTRLMLVGQERVGKTSLKKTLTGQGFDKNEAITDGVETSNGCEISIEVARAGGKMWSIHRKAAEHEGTKEDEYSKALADEIAKRLIVSPHQEETSSNPHLDATDGRGLNPEEAEDFLADEMVAPVEAEEKDDNMPNRIASLVEKMLTEQVRMKEKGTDSTDGGKDESVSLSIWDFAGHDIYYTTHQVFLTWRAIYVVVFDVSRNLDLPVPPEDRDESYEIAKGGSKSELTCLEFINFWLCSIYAHAVAPPSIRGKKLCKTAQKSPPIFIVGTHRESVKGSPKERKKKIDSAFEKIRKTIKKKPFECHVVPKFFAIENSLEEKDQEIVALREHIEKVATAEPYMGEEIPLRWLLFEEALAADKVNHMSLEEAKDLTRSVGIETERELLTMLTFYHDLGYIVYYGDMDDHQSLLRDVVILNPQWLIDVFKQVITILDPDERDGRVSDAWSKLEEDGILEDRLIHYMWQGFLDKKEALLELMAKFDLICEAPADHLRERDLEASGEMDEPRKCYYVPSRLNPRCSPDEMGEIKFPQDFYVDFKGFLPDGLFHRLMTRAVKWTIERDGEPAILFYRQISLMVDDEHQALLEMLRPHDATIKVSVFRVEFADLDEGETRDHHQAPEPQAVREVMDFVVETLDSIRQHWAKQIQYDLCFLCPKCRKRKVLQECFKRKTLQCGIHCRIKSADVKAKFGLLDEGAGSGSESPHISRRSTYKESKVLCDFYFTSLAEQIGSEWHRLAIRLGLNQADIDHVTEDKLTAVDRILAVLQLWKSRSSGRDKGRMIEELCKALTNCSRTDLAAEIREAAGIS